MLQVKGFQPCVPTDCRLLFFTPANRFPAKLQHPDNLDHYTRQLQAMHEYHTMLMCKQASHRVRLQLLIFLRTCRVQEVKFLHHHPAALAHKPASHQRSLLAGCRACCLCEARKCAARPAGELRGWPVLH